MLVQLRHSYCKSFRSHSRLIASDSATSVVKAPGCRLFARRPPSVALAHLGAQSLTATCWGGGKLKALQNCNEIVRFCREMQFLNRFYSKVPASLQILSTCPFGLELPRNPVQSDSHVRSWECCFCYLPVSEGLVRFQALWPSTRVRTFAESCYPKATFCGCASASPARAESIICLLAIVTCDLTE